MDDYYDFDPQHNIDYGKTSHVIILHYHGIVKILLVVMLLYHLPEMMLQ